MSFNISYIFEGIDDFSGVARKISSAMSGLTSKTNTLSSSLKRTSESFTKIGMSAGLRLNAIIDGIGIASIKATADVQQWTASWDIFTKSHKKSEAIMRDMFNISTKFGLSMKEVNIGMIRMAAGREPLRYLHNDLIAMGNISALTGIQMSVLGTNWAKVTAAGRTFGQELMELRRIGVAMPAAYAAVAKQYHITGLTMRKASEDGRISANDYRKIMYELGFAAEFYAGGMKKMANTLSGQFRITRANLFRLRAEVGEQIGSITDLQHKMLMFNMELGKIGAEIPTWVKTHQEMAKIGVYAGIILSLIAPIFLTLGQIMWAVWGISKGFGAILSIIKLIFRVAMFLFLTPLGLIILAITGIVAGVVLLLHHFFTWIQMAHGVGSVFHVIDVLLNGLLFPIKLFFKLLHGVYEIIKGIVKLLWMMLHPFKMLEGLLKKIMPHKAAVHKKAIEIKHNVTQKVKSIPKIDTSLLKAKVPTIPKEIASTIHSLIKPIMPAGFDTLTPQALNVHHTVEHKHVSVQPMIGQFIKSHLAVSLYDPGRYIKSVTGESTGNMTFDTGTNMMMSRI